MCLYFKVTSGHPLEIGWTLCVLTWHLKQTFVNPFEYTKGNGDGSGKLMVYGIKQLSLEMTMCQNFTITHGLVLFSLMTNFNTRE